MTAGAPPKNQLTLQGFIGLLGLFFGLCTIFALVVTAAEAWRENAQAKWPAAKARIQRCGVDPYGSGRRASYRIQCRISYLVGDEEIVTKVGSRSIPSPQRMIWEYPSGRLDRMEAWANGHPQGTAMAVHYDPANHKNAVLVVTDMPLGGPHTPDNLKLLTIAAVGCVVMLSIARIMGRRSSAAGSPARA
jgi:hypothetical protein